ncbi:MAG: hypothetical protein QNL12_06245 [Acidimicrobiia bacterium]|nr:hypothetical protein [Acidimicrobiia bacterium]
MQQLTSASTTDWGRRCLPSIVLAVLLAVVLGACSVGVKVTDAKIADDDVTMTFNLASCNADPTFTVEEAPNQVLVQATRRRTFSTSGDACSDSVTVMLLDPLGDRLVLDLTTGTELNVHRSSPDG